MNSSYQSQMDQVRESWVARPCFVCQKSGRCKHREVTVELALVDVELRRGQLPVEPRKMAVVPMRRRRA